MKKINCNECGRFLFDTEKDNGGAIGAEAQFKGFVYKNAALFSDKYSSLYFCSHECGKAFYQKNIPANPEVSKTLKEARERIPEMAKECAKGCASIVDAFKKIQSR